MYLIKEINRIGEMSNYCRSNFQSLMMQNNNNDHVEQILRIKFILKSHDYYPHYAINLFKTRINI